MQARSYRQTNEARKAADDKSERRSKKDNRGSGAQPKSARPLSKRRSPVGGSPRNKNRKASETSSRRAKNVTNNNNPVGRSTPQNKRGSSAKTARKPAKGRG